jgi:glycosyltransferase involved in cell wall biosynthesis
VPRDSLAPSSADPAQAVSARAHRPAAEPAPAARRPRLCVIGPLVGRTPGRVTSQGEILADLFAAAGYEVRAASRHPNRYVRLLDAAAALIRWRRDVDVVLLQSYSGPSFVMVDTVSALARLLGRTVVFHLHGGAFPTFFARYPRWSRRVLARANAFAAPSSYLAAAVQPYGYASRVIRNVIDLPSYPFRLRERVAPRLFWMRSFHAIYNPTMALRVLARLRATYPEASLVMAGQDDGLLATVRAEAEQMGLGDSVRFPGFLDHAGKIREGGAGGADVFINTNRVDNTPVAVIEAAAMGLPVVATNVGGVSHLLHEGETGLLVPDDDDAGMAAAIARLIEEPSLAARLSANGRALAERSAWESVRAEWEQLFADLAPHWDRTRRAEAR